MINQVLIIDDEVEVLETLTDFFKVYGLKNDQIITCKDAMEGLEVARTHKFSITLLICDYYMPKTNGAELCSLLKENVPGLKVVLHTGDADLKLGDFHYIDKIIYKPCNYEHFMSQVNEVLKVSTGHSKDLPQPPNPTLAKYHVGVVAASTDSLVHGVITAATENSYTITINANRDIKVGDQVKIALSSYDSQINAYGPGDMKDTEVVLIKRLNNSIHSITFKF